ncbi:MAG: alpha/beta hydrolase [Gemmatimonadota bacterium]
MFVHGWMCDRTFWRSQTEEFAADHQVVLIDLGGHGESGRGRVDWTMGGFPEDVIAVLDALDLDDVILVGHSMGGPVVAEVAAKVPNRIRGLVAVDAYQYFGLPVLRGTGVATMVARFEAEFVGAARTVVQNMFVETSDPALIERITGKMLAGPPEVGIAAMRSNFEWYRDEGAAVLGELTLPITVINSTEYFPTDLDLLGEIAPSAVVTLMDGVGHFVMLEDASQFNGILTDAIADMTGQRR